MLDLLLSITLLGCLNEDVNIQDTSYVEACLLSRPPVQRYARLGAKRQWSDRDLAHLNNSGFARRPCRPVRSSVNEWCLKPARQGASYNIHPECPLRSAQVAPTAVVYMMVELLSSKSRRCSKLGELLVNQYCIQQRQRDQFVM